MHYKLMPVASAIDIPILSSGVPNSDVVKISMNHSGLSYSVDCKSLTFPEEVTGPLQVRS